MDPSPALLQRQSISSEQSCCLNAVASSDSIGSSKDLLLKLQKAFVDFFWGGHYWLPPGVLCLPVNEGGQGLIHLTSKVKAMRLQTAQKLLYFSDSTPWISFGLAILQRKSKMGLDKQMF